MYTHLSKCKNDKIKLKRKMVAAMKGEGLILSPQGFLTLNIKTTGLLTQGYNISC
jgi:hypothetical protein